MSRSPKERSFFFQFLRSMALPVLCLATETPACEFRAIPLQRRALRPNDVKINLHFCGVCHTDLHIAAGHMANVRKPQYPLCPGHELAGIVEEVGDNVTMHKVGDRVGVGCMVDSCMKCSKCLEGEHQKCSKNVSTYNDSDKNGRAAVFPPKSKTLGGYSKFHVCDENFAVKIPEGYDLSAAGPVMCAGITMYDPLKKLKVTNGTRVGIVGLGGLGVMGVKLAKAMGATVTVISRNDKKREIAMRIGANDLVASENKESMAKHEGTLDVILNTIPSFHDYVKYNSLLDSKSTIRKQVLLGLHEGLVAAMAVNAVTMGYSNVMASGIGGIKNTQEVINLCAKNGITPEIEVVHCREINRVYTMLDSNNDKGKRFVLDLSTLEDGLVAEGGPPTIKPIAGMGARSILKEVVTLLFGGGWRRSGRNKA